MIVSSSWVISLNSSTHSWVSSKTAAELLEPHNYRSALELIVPGSFMAIHG
jgi:hypothetical protein